MSIHNYTPHHISIVNEEGSTITFPSEGVIRAAQSALIGGKIDGCPIGAINFGEPVGLPNFVKGDWYIVSRIASDAMAAAGMDTSMLLLTADPVRDTNGIIIGCRMLVPYNDQIVLAQLIRARTASPEITSGEVIIKGAKFGTGIRPIDSLFNMKGESLQQEGVSLEYGEEEIVGEYISIK